MAKTKRDEPPTENEWKLALLLSDWDAAIAEDRRRLKEAFKEFDAGIAEKKGL